MKLTDILEDDIEDMAAIIKMIGKKELTNRDRAKAERVLSKFKAKRNNPKPGDEPVEKSGHFQDPFGGMSGVDDAMPTVGSDGAGVTRY